VKPNSPAGEGLPIARGANIEAVYKALVDAGIIFVPENGGGGVGVRLRKPPTIGAEPTSTPRPLATRRSQSRKKTRLHSPKRGGPKD
jgi:hypothetical protein